MMQQQWNDNTHESLVRYGRFAGVCMVRKERQHTRHLLAGVASSRSPGPLPLLSRQFSCSTSLTPWPTFTAFQYANIDQTYTLYIYIYIHMYSISICICMHIYPAELDEAVKVNDPNTKYSDEVCRNTHRTPHVPCTAHANGKCRKVMTSLNISCIKLRTRTFTHANISM